MSEFSDFLIEHNLIYPAGYVILRALFDLGVSTLEKMDERRVGVHQMTGKLAAVLGRVAHYPADSPDYPFPLLK